MMTEMAGPSSETNGFTVVELVVAIAIFTVCVTAVYLFFGSVSSITEQISRQMTLEKKARVLMKRMRSDLKGMYCGERGILVASDAAMQQQDEPMLLLTTTAHLVLLPEEGPVDIAVVRYYLIRDEIRGSYALLRSDTPFFGLKTEQECEAERFLLATDVNQLRITYSGRDGEALQEWNSSAGDGADPSFPVSFMVEFSLGGDADHEPVHYQFQVNVDRHIFTFEKRS